MAVTTKATIASFGGKLLKLSHNAKTTNCEMSFNLYLPPQAASQKVPLLIYLSGLTCTADNCSEKGFFQHGASKKGIAVLYPDTSPRPFLPPYKHENGMYILIPDRWSKHPRRRRRIRLWFRRRLLCRRYTPALRQRVQHVQLHNRGTARDSL